MVDVEIAKDLLGLDDKWLQPFDVRDPFNDNTRLEGFLSQRPDHRYGALALLRVNDHPAEQLIYATPKLHYPFDKSGDFRFPPVRRIEIYDKLDGTNVLAYRYKDENSESLLTYKLRLFPILRNGKWGAFLDLWKEILEEHPEIPQLPERNQCSMSFELFGSRNEHLITYDEALSCALLFGVDENASVRAPSALETGNVPTATQHAELLAGQDPVGAYNQLREETEANNSPADDDKIRGTEGSVWYVTTEIGDVVLFKCKPESVEAIHWAVGINKAAVEMTCWNLLETNDTLNFETLEPLLLEEYDQDEIDRFRDHIDACIQHVNMELDFRDRALAVYEGVGVSLAEDKGAVMRAIATSGEFTKPEMKKVFSVISKFGS